VDLLDLLIQPVPGRTRESRVEEAAKNILIWLVPMVYAGVLIWTEVYRSPAVSVILLPPLCAGLGAVVCSRLRIDPGYATRLVLGCAFWCFAAAVGLLVLDVMIFPF
jgi:hypothetical protein